MPKQLLDAAPLIPLQTTSMEKEKRIRKNGLLESAVKILDNIDLIAIFTSFLNPEFHLFFETLGKFIFFPIAAIANIVVAILTWRQAYFEKFKNSSTIVAAVVETVVALAIAAAVIGALVFAAKFVLVAPVIFSSVIGFKSLYHLGASIFYGAHFLTSDTNESANGKKAAQHFTAFVASALATAGIVMVFALGKFTFAPLSIAGASIGLLLGAYRYLDLRKQAKKAEDQALVIDREELLLDARSEHTHTPGHKLTNNAALHRDLDIDSVTDLTTIITPPRLDIQTLTVPPAERLVVTPASSGDSLVDVDLSDLEKGSTSPVIGYRS